MHTHPKSELQIEREAQFIQNMGAFMRRDFDTIEGSMRSDVVMVLPGFSWLAGTHRGFEDVSRSIVGLRQVLESGEKVITFLHDGDQMIVRHDIMVRGPMHEVEMTLRVKVRYDEDGKALAISVEPDDLALFDHVLNTFLNDSAAS